MSPIDSKKSSIPTFLQWINKQQYMSIILHQTQREQQINCDDINYCRQFHTIV